MVESLTDVHETLGSSLCTITEYIHTYIRMPMTIYKQDLGSSSPPFLFFVSAEELIHCPHITSSIL